jgi:hypothetical protein
MSEQRDGDCLTNFLTGIVAIPILFFVMVWIFAGCDNIGL